MNSVVLNIDNKPKKKKIYHDFLVIGLSHLQIVTLIINSKLVQLWTRNQNPEIKTRINLKSVFQSTEWNKWLEKKNPGEEEEV